MKRIPLTQNFFATVDSDFDSSKKWSYSHGYAVRSVQNNGRTERIYMHREVMQARSGHYIDHVNGDRLDNRIANLRVCSRNGLNVANSKTRNRTGYKGVTKTKTAFTARLKANGRFYWLGSYKTIKEAAHAYDAAATFHFGEFAQRNFP